MIDNKKVILINGAPGSGKDTAANYIASRRAQMADVKLEKFAKPLKDVVPVLYGLTDEQWALLDSHGVKDQESDLLFGSTPREVQIAISEQLLKPLHGKYVFSKMLYNRIKTASEMYIVLSDCGFQDEVDYIANNVDKKNITLLTVHRTGCNFRSDSRQFVEAEGFDHYVIHNDSSLSDFQMKLLEFTMEVFND